MNAPNTVTNPDPVEGQAGETDMEQVARGERERANGYVRTDLWRWAGAQARLQKRTIGRILDDALTLLQKELKQ